MKSEHWSIFIPPTGIIIILINIIVMDGKNSKQINKKQTQSKTKTKKPYINLSCYLITEGCVLKEH